MEEPKNTPKADNSLQFDVDAHLLLELGERLVARRSIALSELIKNAYDADATEITVRFEKVRQSAGTIIVQDNGNGITLDRLKTAWMRIATSDARVNPKSAKYGRTRTGEKGIGRFACRRLSRRLELSSVALAQGGQRERVSIVFNWDLFESGRDIESIRNYFSHEAVSASVPTGTTLVLNDVRDQWGEKDIARLRVDLLGLISPFSADELKYDPGDDATDPGMRLMFVSPEFPEYEGKLHEEFLEAAWGTLHGAVEKSGIPRYQLSIRDPSDELTFLPKEIRFGYLSEVKFEIHIFSYTRDALSPSKFTIKSARDLGQSQGGVRIYVDGFRIFPYGDPGDDWLRLDYERARRLTATPKELLSAAKGLWKPMLALPGSNQVFGAVAVSRLKNPDIDLNVSRERLVENEAFDELKTFVRQGINWATIQYARVKEEKQPRAKLTSVGQSFSEVQELASEATKVREIERKDILIKQLQRAVRRTKVLIGREEQERIDELSMLRVLASAGVSVMVFEHSLQSLIAGLKRVQDDIESLGQGLAGTSTNPLLSVLENVGNWVTSAEEQAALVGLLVRKEATAKRRSLALKPIVDELGKAFGQYMKSYGVEFSNLIPPALRTPAMFEAELNAIFLNLLTNALKAVRAEHIRKIEITANHDDDGIRIRMKDTGTGVEPSIAEKVFEPFVTTSLPDPLLGVGTGLGLKIVRDLVQTNHGQVQFVETVAPWNTCVEIVFPKG